MVQFRDRVMVQIASFALCVSVLSTLTCALPAFDQRIALGESVGVSYYVSSIHGSDTNSGVSPTEPWKTLNHTSNMMYAVAAPKTNLFLERGSVWVDDAVLSVPFLSQATVSAYGSEALPRPAIFRSRSAKLDPYAYDADQAMCLHLLNPTNAIVSELHLSGCYTGIAVTFTHGDEPSTNFTIEKCSFADIKVPLGANQPSLGRWGKAIYVQGGGQSDAAPTTPAATNIIVRNNIAIRIDVFFDCTATLDGLELDSNTVTACGGNCVSMGVANMHLRKSVFLRDTPEMLFLYGTTDVIIGTVNGNNSIEDTDFNTRGEYEAGPDGCAVDFETSASGFTVARNTFYRSWGAGIMVFGHGTTSHGLLFSENSFAYCGCVQPRSDQASIALMCPNGNRPSGTIENNNFLLCPGVEAIYENPAVHDCGGNVTLSGNSINGTKPIVAEPQVSYNPPSPDNTKPDPSVPVVVFCTTPNATIRYTIDGSRPEASSPEFPATGIVFTWPGPNVAVNVRAFKEGYLPSITNGVLVERRRYVPRKQPFLRSSFDYVDVSGDGSSFTAVGWAVDPSLSGGGVPPVTVQIYVDGTPVASTVANLNRPDLVQAKVAPNPQHGFNFSVTLPSAVAARVAKGHKVVVDAYGIHDSSERVYLEGAPLCLTTAGQCLC